MLSVKPNPLAELDFGWQMKSLESAYTEFRRLPDGRIELNIIHDTVHGVTPPMLKWWFLNINGLMKFWGKFYPRYRVWHPRDHIRYEDVQLAPDGTAGRGSYRRIQEAFEANPNYLINVVDYVSKLDETGIVLENTVAGTRVTRLEHQWVAVENGTLYMSQLVIGVDKIVPGLLFNQFIRPWLLSDELCHKWLAHNVEEVGNFEYFLADYYQQRFEHTPALAGLK